MKRSVLGISIAFSIGMFVGVLAVLAYQFFHSRDNGVEIIFENKSGRDISLLDLSGGKIRNIVEGLPSGEKSPRIICEWRGDSILTIMFSDKSKREERIDLHHPKITVAILPSQINVAVRQAAEW